MRKRFEFGKVDGYGNGRKMCATDLEVELKEKTCGDFKYKTLSICGNIWNNRKTDIIAGGQCLDHMNNYRSLRTNPLFTELYNYWKQYHLNDMHSGTPEQEQLIHDYFVGKRYDYKEACDYLKSINKYTVKYTGYSSNKQYINEDYTYGHGWLVQLIPDEIIDRIECLLS